MGDCKRLHETFHANVARKRLERARRRFADYHDALFVKRNRVDLLLHEDLGGGFSPPAAHKIRRLGRKSREHEVDRTPYKGDRKISFVSYHTRAISMNIVRATAWTLHDARAKS